MVVHRLIVGSQAGHDDQRFAGSDSGACDSNAGVTDDDACLPDRRVERTAIEVVNNLGICDWHTRRTALHKQLIDPGERRHRSDQPIERICTAANRYEDHSKNTEPTYSALRDVSAISGHWTNAR